MLICSEEVDGNSTTFRLRFIVQRITANRILVKITTRLPLRNINRIGRFLNDVEV